MWHRRREVVGRPLADACAHIRLASKGTEDDPAGALQLSYDAARKACAALLVVQGLRATTRGGHIAVMDAVRSQFNDRGGMEVFGLLHTLRRRRNRTEYPDPDSPGVDEARLGRRWTRHAPSWTPPSESSTAEHWTCSG